MESNHKMYIFVNNDLKMDKGKIASQVGHGVQHIVDDILTNYYAGFNSYKQIYKDYMSWKNYNGCVKIVLKATFEQLLLLKELPGSTFVIDAGRTQINPGSLTVVAFYPKNSKKMENKFSKYKLL